MLVRHAAIQRWHVTIQEQKMPTGDNWIEYEGKVYPVAAGQTALEAMLAGGADLFFSCRKGTCRSCMLESVSGDPGESAQKNLPEEFREQNFFLPCMTSCPDKVVARVPDSSKCVKRCQLHEVSEVGPSIYKVLLEPESVIEWMAGQYISIHGPEMQARSYSIVNRPDDYFIELHIRHYPNGAVSDWIVNELSAGDTVELTGPVGECSYSSDMADMPVLLIGNGTGGGVLAGIAEDALRQGHGASVRMVHGARDNASHYLKEKLAELSDRFENFSSDCVIASAPSYEFVADALDTESDLENHIVFLCGAPDMVEMARIATVWKGAELENIKSDPFESGEKYAPKDSEKIASIKPDPELWAALGNGDLLSEILEDFYSQVFEDEKLAPFFRKVTKTRLVEKQWAFLSDLFQGTQLYFGERPFNSHHWMIISDELFDYREKLFFDVVEKYDFPKHLIHRWAATHELFRREIVKSTPRGQWMDGKEFHKPSFEMETLIVDTLCDGCANEIHEGEKVRHYIRTGELFCANCVENASFDAAGMPTDISDAAMLSRTG